MSTPSLYLDNPDPERDATDELRNRDRALGNRPGQNLDADTRDTDELRNRDRALGNRPGQNLDADTRDTDELRNRDRDLGNDDLGNDDLGNDAVGTRMRRGDDAATARSLRDDEQPSQSDEALVGWLENADAGRDRRLAVAVAVETDLAARLADMHERMDAVDAKIAAMGGTSRTNTAAVERVETLRERIDALSDDPDLSPVTKPDHRTITPAPANGVRL